MKKIAFLVVVFSMVALGKAQAQDLNTDSHTIGITIPAVALVDIESVGAKNITMVFDAPTEAGLPLAGLTSNTDLWLNYSYIPTATGKTASVSVGINEIVDGMNIVVQAAVATGTNGGGTRGGVSGAITLTDTAQDIVTGIGASYTGDGASNGHNLTYSLTANPSPSSYEELFASVKSVTVTYTIAEQ